MTTTPVTTLDPEQPHQQIDETKKGALGKTYKAGTLEYTWRGMLVLCFWLLWGDFAFTFFESIFGKFIPLYLKDLQASNSLIGIMTGSIAGLINVFFLPNISVWCDNFRSQWGRRIPFLYVMAPLTVAALVGIGFAPEIAGWFHSRLIVHLAPSVGITAVILAFLCILVVLFHFFNMVLVNAYNWLLRDVVPIEVMPLFLSWFRIIGTVSSSVFLWYVFPHIISHRREVCVGVGLFYLIAFLLMCRNVKEGEYPPAPAVESRPGILKSFALYFQDCLTLPIYRNFFIAYVLASAACACSGPFTILFNRDTLGLNLDEMGKIFAWGGILSAICFLPMGWFCKKFTSLRVSVLGVAGQVLMSVCMLFFVTDKTTFLVVSLVSSFPAVAWQLGSFSLTMELFPKEKFGQFSSGLNIFACGALILGNYLVGQYMDLVHSNYRMVFIWNITLSLLAIIPLLFVSRNWKKHGGPNNYVAPLPPSHTNPESVLEHN